MQRHFLFKKLPVIYAVIYNMQFNREQQIQTQHPDKKRPQMETKNEIENVMERMGAKGERGRAFIGDSNRADRASWRTACSEQRAAKADKRLIQA